MMPLGSRSCPRCRSPWRVSGEDVDRGRIRDLPAGPISSRHLLRQIGTDELAVAFGTEHEEVLRRDVLQLAADPSACSCSRWSTTTTRARGWFSTPARVSPRSPALDAEGVSPHSRSRRRATSIPDGSRGSSRRGRGASSTVPRRRRRKHAMRTDSSRKSRYVRRRRPSSQGQLATWMVARADLGAERKRGRRSWCFLHGSPAAMGNRLKRRSGPARRAARNVNPVMWTSSAAGSSRSPGRRSKSAFSATRVSMRAR